MVVAKPIGGHLASRAVPALRASFRHLSDVYLLAQGGYAPVGGFLNAREVKSVCETLHLMTGEPWSMPVVYPIDDDARSRLGSADQVVLLDESGPAAKLQVEDVFRIDKGMYADHIFRTRDESHPGVAWLLEAGDYSVAGTVEVIGDWQVSVPGSLPISPRDVSIRIAEKGWGTVVGFQTRNPIHRAHEFCTKVALESVDGLVIHPLLGETKAGDIPAEVRLACYDVLLRNYYQADRAILAGFPAWMRYAGPREAVFHAQVRKNYGFSHFIVGRDHAGVGNFYGPYDAQRIFDGFEPGELGIEPVFFDHAHFCRACGGMAFTKTCPHSREHHVHLTGTAVRRMLRNGMAPPSEFTRPEVANILVEAARTGT